MPKILVETKYNKNFVEQVTKWIHEEIHFEEFTQTMAKHVYDLQEKQIRDALINLGWKPPEEL
jgi:hypothetical protein